MVLVQESKWVCLVSQNGALRKCAVEARRFENKNRKLHEQRTWGLLHGSRLDHDGLVAGSERYLGGQVGDLHGDFLVRTVVAHKGRARA